MKNKIFISTSIILIFMITSTFGSAFASANPTAESYIIVFKDTVNPGVEVPEFAKAYGLQPGFVYEHALKGMSAMIPDGRLVALQHDPRVAYVERDLEHHIEAQTAPTGIQRIFADENSTIDIDGADDYRVDVDVAVIDTGIDFQHPDLNVAGGVNCTVSIFSPRCDPGGDDDHYHGTHVAGTIGAIDNGSGVVGVAPGARLWAVKVLNKRGSGYSSWIVAGIDWVAANAATIEVANMSLGGSGFSQAEYDAIQGAVNKGVAFAVAAGNEDDDANNYSPGGFVNVLSVSALADFNGLPGGGAAYTCRADVDDTLADFSNWGPEVDIAAPGVCILSTYPLEKGEYGTISGTSMASPHVAGALALLASRNNPANATDVYALYNTIKNNGNYDWTDDSGDGIKEPLLDVSNAAIFNPVLVPGSGGVPTNNPPTANFTFNTSGLTAIFSDSSSDSDGTIASWTWSFGDGGTSTNQNPSHTYATVGTYTVNLTVTDDDGATHSTSKSVTVSEPSTGQTITVASLTGSSSTVNKNFWKATVTAIIDPVLAGATVAGTWSNGKAFSCTTDSAGQCAASQTLSTKTIASITLTITNVVLSGYEYVASDTTETVTKP
ncbi:MAG: S8 family serine peptidase [Anaerolineaceae bacterium]|nr:S8 family serine peptidase [Anaerolineaceae bacterium]